MSHGRSELRAFRAGRSDVSIPGVFDPGVVGLIRYPARDALQMAQVLVVMCEYVREFDQEAA